MFANSIIVFKQIIVMFFMMLLGYYIFKQGLFDNETTKSMSGLLNRYVMPCTIIRSFQREFEPGLARTFFITMLCAAASFVISIAISSIVYRRGRTENYADRRVCTILTNDGFMALPLLAAMFGGDGVFLGSAHICCMATVLWTYCVYQLSHGRERMTIKKAVFNNPGLLGAVIGMIVFVSPFKLPELVFTAVDFVGDLNTPLAMISLGCFLAQVDFKQCFSDISLWKLSALHMLAIPAILMVLLLFVPIDQTAKLVLLVGVSAPCAIACAMFSQVYGADYLYATRAIALTTVLSVITLPGLIAVMEILMRLMA